MLLCQYIIYYDIVIITQKTSGSLYQFCRDVPNNVITESKSFKFRSKYLENTNNEDIINAKITMPL